MAASSELEERLPLFLNAAVLECPGLMDELPQMLSAIDAGEYINVDRINDPRKRDHVRAVFGCLPLQKNDEWGWHKTSAASIRGLLLNTLMKLGKINEPKNMSQAEQMSSRSSPLILLSMLKQFPSLLQELPVLLEQILGGNHVQLQDIGDEDLIEALERLLKSLGLVERRDGFCIPDEGSSFVYAAVNNFNVIFADYHRLAKQQKKRRREEDTRRKRERKDKKSSSSARRKGKHDSDSNSDGSSDSSGSDGSDSDESSTKGDEDIPRSTMKEPLSHADTGGDTKDDGEMDDAPIVPSSSSRAIQGPARPSASDLAVAQQLQSTTVGTHSNYEDEDDSEDDGFGPRVHQPGFPSSSVAAARAAYFTSALPLGFVGVDAEAMFADSRAAVMNQDTAAEVAAATDDGVSKREEWILNPGDSQALAALGGGGSDPMAMFGKSRKFQAGKQAKKAAEALIIQREYARSMQEKSGGGEVTLDEESKAAQKAEEERNLRGPSLMEEHLAKRAKHDHSRGKERTPFDREKDILQRKKLGAAEVQQLVVNARELTNRFDQPVVQKSFL